MKFIEAIKNLNKPTFFEGTKHNQSGILKRIMEARQVTVAQPTSYDYDPDGMASTCIRTATFDPNRNLCYITFVPDPEKTYTYSMTSEQFEEFMNSESKGKYLNYVMEVENVIPSLRNS